MEYTKKREKTRNLIERSFWDIYTNNGYKRVTVREICEKAGIHRSTFYSYYQSVSDVFDGIKEHQLSVIEEITAVKNSSEKDFLSFLERISSSYEENSYFLKPLLIERHSASFSEQYRLKLKNALRRDSRMSECESGSAEDEIVEIVLTGFVEAFIQCLGAEKIRLPETWPFAYQIMEKGVKPALAENFGL